MISVLIGYYYEKKVGFHRLAAVIFLLFPLNLFSLSFDSLFEPVFRSFVLLPEYYLRFNMSTFAFHHDAFLKRQYLAEPHPDLEFKLITYKNMISSVWDVDFIFGLGEVPGNNVFTVLNVAFGIDPAIELNLRDLYIETGISHSCFHEVDRNDFPIVYYNRIHIGASSKNFRLNEYFSHLVKDSLFSPVNRISWKFQTGYYLKAFFDLVDPNKLDGNNPCIADFSSACRYAFYRRRSWILSVNGETTFGWFSRGNGYHVRNHSSIFWKHSFGIDAFFSRGGRGSRFFLTYHLDDLPTPKDTPDFTLGNSRFSKNLLLQIGISFFN